MRIPTWNPRATLTENARVAREYYRNNGSERAPDAPRSLIFQKASRGAVVSWALPARYQDVRSFRIYADNETSLYGETSDRGARQYFVESQGGDTPPKRLVFVCAVSITGRESKKVGIHIQAATELGVAAPSQPSSPPGYTGTDGRNRTTRSSRYGLSEL